MSSGDPLIFTLLDYFLANCFTQDAKEEDIVVQVCLFAFDLLYLNGKVLTVDVPVVS